MNNLTVRPGGGRYVARRPTEWASRLRKGKNGLISLAFMLPALAIYSTFLVYPMIRSLVGSFFSWQGIQISEFAGLANFWRVFSSSTAAAVGNAFTHNVIWFFCVLVGQNIMGLFFAYLIHRRRRFGRVLQWWFFLPAILSPVLVGSLWRLLLSPRGPIETILGAIGIHTGPITWLGQSDIALYILIGIDIWNWVGLPILVFVAGFGGIDPKIFEAARVDGAGSGRVLFAIATPILLPSVATLSVLAFINSFNQFDTMYVVEGLHGNPDGSTDVLVALFYRFAFGSAAGSGRTDIGVALALGTLLFLFVVLISTQMIRFFERRNARLQ